MARRHFWQYLLDENGNPVTEAEVRIYLAGTNQEADIYVSPEFGSATTSSNFDLKTDLIGFFEVWFGDVFELAGGYNNDQLFDIKWTKDSFSQTIENVMVYAPLGEVDVNSTNTDKNKAISNAQGYRWDTHVDSEVPSASPHNLFPVEFFSTDDTYNKVISNKLSYQMRGIVYDGLTVSIDTSAANYFFTNISSWSLSADALSATFVYYDDVSHNLENNWPIVRVMKQSNDIETIPKRVISLNSNQVRIVMPNNSPVRVVVIG
jgi:hypothetical protein